MRCEPDTEAVDFMERKAHANSSVIFCQSFERACKNSTLVIWHQKLPLLLAGWKRALFCRLYLAFDIATWYKKLIADSAKSADFYEPLFTLTPITYKPNEQDAPPPPRAHTRKEQSRHKFLALVKNNKIKQGSECVWARERELLFHLIFVPAREKEVFWKRAPQFLRTCMQKNGRTNVKK